MNKVLIHHRTQGKGVEAVHLQGIAGGMKECGCSAEIVSPPGVDISTIEGKKGIAKSIAGKTPQAVFECLELIYNVPAFFQLMKARRHFGCTILYERYAFLGVAGACAARIWGIPFVVEVNYTVDNDLEVRSRSKIFLPFTKFFEHLVFQSASLLLPVSSKLAGELAQRGYDENKILVSPNAVDISNFHIHSGPPGRLIKELFGEPPGVVIGFVGSFAAWHRVDLLIESCLAAADSLSTDIGLILIGEGGNKDVLLKKSSHLPRNMKIVFPGFIPHSSLPGYIASMDIAVMPHSNEYGSPMKVFEYMALGKPVIAPDFGPLRDAIDQGQEGLLFTPGSREELTKAILLLANKPEQRLAMGLKARMRVEKDHNWKARCVRILDMLNSESGSFKAPVKTQASTFSSYREPDDFISTDYSRIETNS